MEMRMTMPLMTFQLRGKKKPQGFSSNLIYGGIHFSERTHIFGQVKQRIALGIRALNIPIKTFENPVCLTVIINASTSNYDIDNYGYVYCKAFLDAVKEIDPIVQSGKNKGKVRVDGEKQCMKVPLIKGDNSNCVTQVVYLVGDQKDDTVTFVLKELSK